MPSNRNGRKLVRLWSIPTLLLLLSIALAPQPPKLALAQPIAVGLVTDTGTLADKGFNWYSYQGVLRAESELGVVGTVYTSTSDLDYEPNLNQCVADGNDLCLSVGFLTGDAMWKVANANPDTRFAVVDMSYDTYPTNLRGIQFASKEGAYLAGTLAGLMTNSDVLGVIGGMPIPAVDEFIYGFRNGARCANISATVLISYTNDFANPDLGAQYAQAMIAQGADLIFPPAGGTASGALLTATQSGVWGIGVDTDLYYSVFASGTVPGSDKLLSSALKRMDNAVFLTIADVVSGTFSSGTRLYDLAEDGVGIAPFHEADPFVPQPVRDQLDLVRQGIISGTIDPSDPCWAYTRYVDGASGSDGGDCGDPNAPCATVGYALGQAQPDDQVLVAGGTYTENLWVNRLVYLQGGYSGPPAWQRDLLLYPTTIRSGRVTIPGDWDGDIYDPYVISDSGTLKMWYSGNDISGVGRIGYADSPDALNWTRLPTNPVLDVGAPGEWDDGAVGQPSVLEEGGLYKMWFRGAGPSSVGQIGYATSTNGIDWVKYAGNPVLTVGTPGEWDDSEAGGPTVLFDGATYHMWYHGASSSGTSIGYATSTNGIDWVKQAGNPVFGPSDPGNWDSGVVFFPAVLTDSGHLSMWYSTNYKPGGVGIGHVTSTDGISWTRTLPGPVLPVGGPGEWDESHVQTPAVLAEGGTYRMWYTGYSGDWQSVAFGYATSSDGISWTKSISNPVFLQGTPGQWGAPVVTFDPGSDGAVLDGFTITGGDAPQGAGVLVQDGTTVTLLRLTVQGNHGYDGGGIRVANGSTALISATVIVSNTATWGGGVLVDLGGAVAIVASDIRGNTAEQSGGGIDAWWPDTMVSISQTTVAGNSTAGQGGGIHATEDAVVYLADVTLLENTAGVAGGGLSLEQRAWAQVTASGFFSNTAFWGGGLHIQFGSAATLDDCRVEDNAAVDSGGGIRLLDGSLLTMTNGLVAGNSTPREESFAGIEFAWPSSGGLLVNVTVADNELSSGVGGIRHADPTWPLTIVNSIVYGNAGEQLRCENGGGCDVTYSDIAGGWAGTGNIDDDPLFAGGDYHLQDNSPCVDSGTTAGAPAYDWEGDPRPFAHGVDMGADEWWVQLGVSLGVAAPTGSGVPGATVVYTLALTNTGAYTDSYALQAAGVWTPTLSVGMAGPLAPGAGLTFTLSVLVPADAQPGATDVTVVTATSELEASVSARVLVTTTALQAGFRVYLPLVFRNVAP